MVTQKFLLLALFICTHNTKMTKQQVPPLFNPGDFLGNFGSQYENIAGNVQNIIKQAADLNRQIRQQIVQNFDATKSAIVGVDATNQNVRGDLKKFTVIDLNENEIRK